MRTTITVPAISAPLAISSPVPSSPIVSSTVGSCNPISTNSAELRTNVRISQTAIPWIRVVGVVSFDVSRPM